MQHGRKVGNMDTQKESTSDEKFEEWFIKESGWGPMYADETYKLAEYNLAKEAWNEGYDLGYVKGYQALKRERGL